MSGKRGRWWSFVAFIALCWGGHEAATAAGAQPAIETASPVQSGEWPRDDVFTSALAQSGLVTSPRFRALKLLSAPPAELLVMPVQMQAHGWSAAFSALIGAQLDRALADRGVKANRQIDLFDLDGPFARRFSMAEVQSFSKQHGSLPVLAVFAGRDAEGSVLLTLEWRREGRVGTAHRTLPEGRSVEDVLKSIALAYPDMLTEAGIAVRPTTAPQPRPCPAEGWQLKATDADRIQVACQALVMGALLPNFQMRSTRMYPQVRSRAKLAALAHAYVEADLLTAGSGAAMRAVAWAELELDSARAQLEAHTSVEDPVGRPLARLLWSRVRGEKLPVASRQSAEQAYLEPEAATLPAFARAAYLERASFVDSWHRVDFCALEEQIAIFRSSSGCEAVPGRRIGTAAELTLLTEWRFAKHYRDVEAEASLRADRAGWERAWKQVPSDVAAHPFVRWLRFRSEQFDRAHGTFDSVVRQVRSAAADSTLALAEVQREEGRNVEEWALAQGRWTSNEAFKSDADVLAAERSERLLSSALAHEGFVLLGILPRKRTAAEADVPWQVRLGMTPPVPVQVPPGARDHPSLIFMRGNASGLGMSEYALKAALRDDPQDMMARVATAMLRWKAGASLAEVRRFIDQHPEDQRVDGGIGNSNDWAIPAHAFFFAGELDAARDYYQRAAKFNTGSESELMARQRLRLIDGDLRGALDAVTRRLNRYGSDFARRDAAGLSFLLGKTQSGWALLAPRLPTSSDLELWAAVDAGLRQGGRSIAEARQWVIDSGSGRVRVGGRGMEEWMMQRLLVLDRQPADNELVLARGQWREEDGGAVAVLASVELARAIWAEQPPAEVARLRSLLLRVSREQASKLAPLYVWTVHRANAAANELALRNLQGVETTQPFDVLLAAAVLAGLDHKRDESLALLGAARKELSSYGAPTVLNDELRSPPYMLGLMSHLLFRQTGEQAYREEALRLARAYQRIFPYLAWPHALGALSTNDPAERARSACRARTLDSRSRFLELAGAAERGKCPASLW